MYDEPWDLATRPDWAEETSFRGLVYHGSMLTQDSEAIWTDVDVSYSDWGAIWVSPDEKAAEAFAGRYLWSRPLEDGQVPFVIRIAADFPNLIDLTDFSTEAAEFQDSEKFREAAEFRDEWCSGDVRECIGYFRQWGFDGWLATGSISQSYQDIAVWNGVVEGTEVKILMPDGKWSAYMSEEEANKLLEFST